MGFIAVHQELDIDNTKALITVVIGWLVVFIGSLIIAGLLLDWLPEVVLSLDDIAAFCCLK